MKPQPGERVTIYLGDSDHDWDGALEVGTVVHPTLIATEDVIHIDPDDHRCRFLRYDGDEGTTWARGDDAATARALMTSRALR